MPLVGWSSCSIYTDSTWRPQGRVLRRLLWQVPIWLACSAARRARWSSQTLSAERGRDERDIHKRWLAPLGRRWHVLRDGAPRTSASADHVKRPSLFVGLKC